MTHGKRFGIGMTQKQVEEFWQELVLMLIGIPILIVIGAIIISVLLETTGFGYPNFVKYFLISVGFVGWIIAIYIKNIWKRF